MSKGAYVGINGTAHKIKDIYVGVNNIAHKVVKGYVGVNGVAHLFWDGGGSQGDVWDYWISVPGYFLDSYGWSWNDVLQEDVWRKIGTYHKDNNLIAYYGLAVIDSGSPQYPNACLIMISPNPDAVTYTHYDIYYDDETSSEPIYYNPSTKRYNSTIVDVNNITWYVNAFWFYEEINIDEPYPFNKRCLLNELTNPLPDTAQGHSQAIQLMLNNVIYSVPFHGNYQTGNYYTFNLCDNEKILRKSFGVFLFKNISDSYGSTRSTAYMSLSNNVDTIIQNIIVYLQSLQRIGDRLVLIIIEPNYYGYYIHIQFPEQYIITPYFRVYNRSISQGFDSATISFNHNLSEYRVYINSDGSIAYSHTSAGGVPYAFVGISIYQNTYGYTVRSSNMGLDL